METPEPYTLISTLGLAPAIITELIWTYATDPDRPRMPERVILITTTAGYLAWQKKAVDNGMWERFCNEILGGIDVKPEFRIKSRFSGEPIIDIQKTEDDLRVANIIYDEVDQLTRPGSPPLVGSLAGGRKTMSAHMMAAFTIFARRSDELVHVLASEELERADGFYYPPPGASQEEYPIYRVNIPFAPMHAYLVRDFFGEMPTDVRNLNALMDTIRNYEFAPPDKAVVYIANGKWQSSTIELHDATGNELDTFQLSRQNLCTLLILAYHLKSQPAGVSNTDLLHNNVQDQHRAFNALFSSGRTSAPWTEPEELTKAISRLNTQLKTNESALRHLSIEGTRTKKETRYTWLNESGLEIELRGPEEVISRANRTSWNRLFSDWQIVQQ